MLAGSARNKALDGGHAAFFTYCVLGIKGICPKPVEFF